MRVEKGHGRLERRQIRVSSDLEGYSSFPGLKQVAQVTKRVVFLKTGEVKETTEYLLTSLSAERARPARLLGLMRGHWGIENRLFHVKDDSFGPDTYSMRDVSGLWGGPPRVVFTPQWGSDEPATGSGRQSATGSKPAME